MQSYNIELYDRLLFRPAHLDMLSQFGAEIRRLLLQVDLRGLVVLQRSECRLLLLLRHRLRAATTSVVTAGRVGCVGIAQTCGAAADTACRLRHENLLLLLLLLLQHLQNPTRGIGRLMQPEKTAWHLSVQLGGEFQCSALEPCRQQCWPKCGTKNALQLTMLASDAD